MTKSLNRIVRILQTFALNTVNTSKKISILFYSGIQETPWRGHVLWEQSVTGKKRGRPSKPVADQGTSKVKRHPRKLTWTDVGREEYNRVVCSASVSGSSSSQGRGRTEQRFERGEGGGVT